MACRSQKTAVFILTRRMKLIGNFKWCLNGHQFSVCNSPDCAIYQFRKERERPHTIPQICSQTGGTEGGKAALKPRAIETHGKGRALANAV